MDTNLDFDYTFQLELADGGVVEGGSTIELEVETDENDELDSYDAYMIALETIMEQLYENDEDFDLDALPNLTITIENMRLS
ncbi:MAG: hypothetical protein KC418_13090 [Anaerolineales bacterium]|nr:hypothetical protein [Anaerolineales bacterium]MCB8950704.1 hypothetical protein [Ardenticatenales bacterium]